MRWMTFLCALLLLISAAQAEAPVYPPEGFDRRQEGVEYGTLRYEQYHSATTGRTRNVIVLLPPGYSQARRYPVLYLLHGSNGDENEWLRGKPQEVIGNLIAAGEAAEMIVVMPNVRARANDAANPPDWNDPDHYAAFDNFINDLRDDLMPFISANFSVAEGRENTAIAGLSIGGKEALYIGLTLQDAFGYVGAFSPSRGVLPDDGRTGLIPLADFKVQEGLDTYIFINTGDSDRIVRDWPQTYSNALKSNGTAHTFCITLGGHAFSVWQHGLYNFCRNIFK